MTPAADGPRRRPRALLLDLGNVAAFFDHQRACRALSALTQPVRTPDELYDAIFRSGLEAAFDRGAIGTAEFVARLRGWCPGASERALTEAWSDIFRPNPDVLDVLPDLRRAGMRVVLASNTNELHFAWLARHLPAAVQGVDAAVLSYRVGVTKPATAFFEACVDQAGVDRGACLFVDDKPEYVEAARAIGIDAVVYTTGVLRQFS